MPIRHGEGPTEKQLFIAAEIQQESGGNYDAVNPSSGALGAAQIMPGNLPGWARQCGLPVLTPSEFLRDHAYQDSMIGCVLGGYYDQYGARGAASMWYSGQPDWHATYGNPPVYQYVDDVMALMGDKNLRPFSGGGSGSGFNAPVPLSVAGNNDWSGRVSRSASRFTGAAQELNRYANAIARTTRR